MEAYNKIERKLQQFSRKYYTSELIKGSILFISLGCLFLFFTLFLEYFLWLEPIFRAILFWFVVLVELFFLIKFIAIPIFKLMGLKKGISYEEASIIIGKHFPEVRDKLLNVLQLKIQSSKLKAQNSKLLLASIDQKSSNLKAIPFVRAVDFNKNIGYLKYITIPIIIWLLVFFTSSNEALSKSFERVINYNTAYQPPAPFSFRMLTKNLKVVQGKSFTVLFDVQGNTLPKEAEINFENQSFYLQKDANGIFSYTFSQINQSVSFYLSANGVQSKEYLIKVLKTPTILGINLNLRYPKYLKKKNEKIKNSGNVTVPEGTIITWNVRAVQSDTITFLQNKKRIVFKQKDKQNFIFKKYIKNPISYQISSSNKLLTDYEKLNFSIRVLRDEFPYIKVSSDIDSVSMGTVQFAGKISDDYGLSKLQLVYYDINNPQNKSLYNIAISKKNIQTFFHQFPDGLSLKTGVTYELFFQVFDNDRVNGNKKATSRVFAYRNKTEDETEQELLEKQQNIINNIEKHIQKQQNIQKELEKVKNSIQTKKSINWNDKNEVQKMIERHNQYNKIMERQTENLYNNLDEKKDLSKSLQQKKEELKSRLSELKKIQKQKNLLDEIEKVAEKLNKEKLLKKTKELAQQNKQKDRSLERILELIKRFYVEQKTMQVAKKINKLAEKEEELINKNENVLESQKKINKEFNDIKEDLDNLEKDNEKLKAPMELPDIDKDKEDIDSELKKSENNLINGQKSRAKKSQKNATIKMRQMSSKMQSSLLDMQGESINENIEDLRKILENLITFSFKQEALMDQFNRNSVTHPDFGKNLKQQSQLKTYFEHIDDSLYVLSMRVPKISNKIQDDLATTHYNLNQSLENFSENRFTLGLSNQQYIMTSVNNLAHYLSNILSNMRNSIYFKNSGKGDDFSLPDLIEGQGKLAEKMEKKIKGKKGKGERKGENKESDRSLDSEIFETYKQQSKLRNILEQQLNELNAKGQESNKEKKMLEKMKELENEILERGFNVNTLQKMKNMHYELLKLDKAKLSQGQGKERKSNTNTIDNKAKNIRAIKFQKQFYNQTEILNRHSLPLRQYYKKKVVKFFSDTNK